MNIQEAFNIASDKTYYGQKVVVHTETDQFVGILMYCTRSSFVIQPTDSSAIQRCSIAFHAVEKVTRY